MSGFDIHIMIGPTARWQLWNSWLSGSSDDKSVMSGFDIYIMIGPSQLEAIEQSAEW